MDEVKRAFLFSQGTPITDALTLLYHQWDQETPTLFDPMTIAFIVNPALCPVQPMHIRVDEKGFTRPDHGPPNAQVCLDSNPDAFFRFLLPRLAAQEWRPLGRLLFTFIPQTLEPSTFERPVVGQFEFFGS